MTDQSKRNVELVSEADCDVREILRTRDDRYEICGITPAKVNRMFAEFLAKGMSVYGAPEDGWMSKLPDKGSLDDWHTHSALVINVEPIAKEPEDSYEKLVQDLADHARFNDGGYNFALNTEHWVERARKLKGMK